MKKRLLLVLVGATMLLLTMSLTAPAAEKGIPVHGHFYVTNGEWLEFSATVETNSLREAFWGGMLTMQGFAEWTRRAKQQTGTIILPSGERLVTHSTDTRKSLAGIKDPVPAETSEQKSRNLGAFPLFNFK